MIRNATLKDIPELIEIENLSFGLERFAPPQFRYLIKRSKAEFIVTAPYINGYAVMLMNKNHKRARIYSIAVHPKYRGRGLARFLMEHLEDKAKYFGFSGIKLEVRADNKYAIGFYQDLGYVYNYKKPHYYRDKVDGLIYIKDF